MDERLAKQWAVIEQLLREAAVQVQLTPYFAEFEDFLGHNELEIALDTLAAAGEECSVSPEYWRLLKQAADVMGLKAKAAEFRHKRRAARAKNSEPT